jgi:hypothetical protein
MKKSFMGIDSLPVRFHSRQFLAKLPIFCGARVRLIESCGLQELSRVWVRFLR